VFFVFQETNTKHLYFEKTQTSVVLTFYLNFFFFKKVANVAPVSRGEGWPHRHP